MYFIYEIYTMNTNTFSIGINNILTPADSQIGEFVTVQFMQYFSFSRRYATRKSGLPFLAFRIPDDRQSSKKSCEPS
jgi:hypothetical protein